jgi:hypothetical protein
MIYFAEVKIMDGKPIMGDYHDFDKTLTPERHAKL